MRKFEKQGRLEEIQNLTNEILFEDNRLDSDELEKQPKTKKKIKTDE